MTDSAEPAAMEPQLSDATETASMISSFNSGPDMALILRDKLQQKEPETLRWAFEDEMISAWLDGKDSEFQIPGKENSVFRLKKLWLYGFPGCGRSVLTASIVDHLIRNSPKEDAVVYYFCSRLTVGMNDPVNILKCLLSQLAEQNANAAELLKGYLLEMEKLSSDLEGDDIKPLRVEDLGKLFVQMCKSFKRVSVILNSVEMIEVDEERNLISTLCGDGSTDHNVWLLLTAAERPGQKDLAMEMQFCAIYVHGRPEDIRIWAKTELSRRIDQGEHHLEMDVLCDKIENYVVERSHGAWLWAVCELDNICEISRQGSWETPGTPPASIDASAHPYWNYGPDPENKIPTIFPYDAHVSRVLERGHRREEFILGQVLRWVYVGGLLPELRFTIEQTCDYMRLSLLKYSIEKETEKAVVSEEEVFRAGGKLLRKSVDGTRFEFSHYTVEGYLMAYIREDNKKFKFGEQVDSDVTDELEWNGRLEDAKRMMLDLMPCRKRLWGPIGNPILAAYNNYAMFQERHGSIDEAEEYYMRALRGYERSQKPNREAMYNTCHNLGILNKRRGMYKEAEDFYKRALDGREELLGPHHEDTLGTIHSLGLLYATGDRLDEAGTLWKRYLEGVEESLGQDDPKTILALYDLGTLFRNQNRFDAATPLIERAMRSYERTKGEDDSSTLNAMNSLASLYAIDDRFDDALSLWKRVLGIQQRILPDDHEDTLFTKRNLAILYLEGGKFEEARDMYKNVLKRCLKLYGLDHPSTGDIYRALADTLEGMGALDEAEGMAVSALEIYEKTLGPNDLTTVKAVDGLALIYAKQERLDDAAPLWEKALDGYRRLNGEDDPCALGRMQNLGRLYKIQFRMGEAEKMFEDGFEGAMRSLGPDGVLTRGIGEELVLFYENQGRDEKAKEIAEKLGQ